MLKNLKIKGSLRKVSLIALAVSMSNFSPARSQSLETRLNEEEAISSPLPTTFGSPISILYDIIYRKEKYDKSNQEKWQKQIEERTAPYEKPLEMSWWCKFKTIDVGWGVPKDLFGSYEGKVIEFTFSIPYMPTSFGIGTILSEGNYGKDQIGSILPAYIEFPLYMHLALPKSGRISRTENGQLMMHYDYVKQGGEWTYAQMLTSFFIGGSNWGAPEMGVAKQLFMTIISQDDRYINAEDPTFEKNKYFHTGINHTFFLPIPPPLPNSIALEGGLLLEESTKFKDSFYVSIGIGMGTAMWVKLR